MSRLRFPLLLALLALVVGSGSFALATSVLDDGKADPPPEATGSAASPGGDPTSSTTSTTVAPGAVTTEKLKSPSFILVVSSDAPDEAGALVIAEQVAADGHPAGVLKSNDYRSLNPGFWVAYAGPYPDLATAEAAIAELTADGYTGAYPRCAGSNKDCGRDEAGDEGD